MSAATADVARREGPPRRDLARTAGRFNRWDTPWLNLKLIAGVMVLVAMVLFGVLGGIFWDTTLARVSSGPLSLPPAWMEGGNPNHPLGTQNSGRDMLALMISGAPNTLRVGFIVGGIGMGVGILFGFMAGFIGRWVDAVIRTAADVTLTIPALAVLIVLSSFVRVVDVNTMAFIVSLFAWAGPTRLIRAQVLSMRERGYVRMARLSGISTPRIMFGEMMPNMLPYLAASFAGNVSAGILAAIGLEALGLGPQRVPTLGMTIFWAIRGSALLRGMWWWWGFPLVILVIIFASLFLITIGLDDIANPRLKEAKRA